MADALREDIQEKIHMYSYLKETESEKKPTLIDTKLT